MVRPWLAKLREVERHSRIAVPIRVRRNPANLTTKGVFVCVCVCTLEYVPRWQKKYGPLPCACPAQSFDALSTVHVQRRAALRYLSRES